MLDPEIYRSRYSRLYLSASRKGFDLEVRPDGTWGLKDQAGATVNTGGTSLDDVAAYLMTRPLIG